MGKKIKYRLYALTRTEANIDKIVNERFCRITSGYILHYTDKRKKKDAVEIKADDLNRLTADDVRWLYECNLAIIAEEINEEQASILASLSNKINALESALERESKEN